MSARNPRVAQLRQLVSSRRERRQQRRYVIEGPRLLGEALDARVSLVEAFAAPDADRELRRRLDRAGVVVHPVASGVLDRVGDVQTSQGWLGVAEITGHIADPPQGVSPLVLVLVGISDPGNVGTLLRAADAAGANAVVVSPQTADPFSPKVVRASAGSLFRVPLVESAAPLEVARGWGLATVGCVVRGGDHLYQVDLDLPVAVVLGSEAHGLAPDVEGRLDRRVTIPMPGRAESLNVAMAGTVVIFEALRQRASGVPTVAARRGELAPPA
jgi:TrmH family RNA methyltransferase